MQLSQKSVADKAFELWVGAGELKKELEELYYLSGEGKVEQHGEKAEKEDEKEASKKASRGLSSRWRRSRKRRDGELYEYNVLEFMTGFGRIRHRKLIEGQAQISIAPICLGRRLQQNRK